MEIKAFQGWRFSTDDGDVSRLIAPPYDILSADDKRQLLQTSPHNIVAVDLPHVPPSEVGADSEYQASAATLRQWMASGVLRREAAPCLYAYEQCYTWAGRSHRRRTLIAAVRVTEFGQGVWPHEKTFAGPKADRLKLTQETKVQLSPIFGFYEPQPAIARTLDDTCRQPPSCSGQLRGVQEKLWAISDPSAVGAICHAMTSRDIFIADGHHRYTTALNYRKTLGDLPGDHPANYVLFVLAAMDDPGLIILPTHRLFSGLSGWDFERFVASASSAMEFKAVDLTPAQAADADGMLAPYGPHAMALLSGNKAYIGRLKDESVMTQVAEEELPAWRQLDVSILHRLVMDKHLAAFGGTGFKTQYTPDGEKALAAARSGEAQLVVLLAGTPISAVREIALAGATMPHKSTYFYPKPATGLVIYPLG